MHWSRGKACTWWPGKDYSGSHWKSDVWLKLWRRWGRKPYTYLEKCSVPDRSQHKYNNPGVRRTTRRPCALWGEKWNISCHIREQRISQSSAIAAISQGWAGKPWDNLSSHTWKSAIFFDLNYLVSSTDKLLTGLPTLCCKTSIYPSSSHRFLRAVSQSHLKRCLLGCSPHLAPSKT